jgi:hypothetical protein
MELKGKKENIAIIEDNSFEYRQWKNGANCLIIINGTKQTEDNIIKILDEEILSQVTLEPEAAIKKYGSEGKMGPWKLPLKTQYYFQN